MKVKHRFCPLCRKWYVWGYGFSSHKCCKKYPALRLEFGWELINTIKGKEYANASREIMLSTQKTDGFKEPER